MRGLFGFVMFCSLLMVGSLGARAEEQLMNLWPNQRVIHDREMGMQAEEYHVRGQEYVDHLYATGGETPIAESDAIHDVLMDVYPIIDPVDVNIDEVATIIKAKDGE
ncbi:MAG: hypothetical protein PHX61_08245 [Alphaproteobacteria bacterium]|nr:hypothetical protein [Alphaproteobacteria bacterium]